VPVTGASGAVGAVDDELLGVEVGLDPFSGSREYSCLSRRRLVSSLVISERVKEAMESIGCVGAVFQPAD
jgi:hypothetical protein